MNTYRPKDSPRVLEGFRGYTRTILKLLVVVDRLFGVDTRSLALFRVGLSLVLLDELTVRARNLTAFYTDQGVMPRGFITENTQNVWSFSLHLASGSVYFEALLFFCALSAAVALFLGYKTRLATFISWLLLASLYVRNPEVQSSGDILMLMLLFWGLFLPLNLHWSVDRARATNGAAVPLRVLSTATAAVLVQAALVYLFASLLKTGEPWHNGTAVWLALNWDQGTTALGRTMLNFPWLLALLTPVVLWFELLAPIALFIPFYTPVVRLVVIPLLVLMHLSFAALMVLATFPFVSIVSVIPFLPTRFWQLFGGGRSEGITIFYDGGCSFCKTTVLLIRTFFVLPRVKVSAVQEDAEAEALMKQNSWVVQVEGDAYTRAAALKVLLHASPILWPFHYLFGFKPFLRLSDKVYGLIASHRPGASRAMQWFQPGPLRWKLPWAGQVAAGLLLVYVVMWNVASYRNVAAPFWQVANVLQIHQSWGMFAPYPKVDDGWFVVPAVLRDGERIDVFRAVISGDGEKMTWDKPASVAARFPNVQWRKYLENLVAKEDPGRYRNFAIYLYNAWNKSQPKSRELVRLDVYYLVENSERLSSPPEKIHLWEHHFSDE